MEQHQTVVHELYPPPATTTDEVCSVCGAPLDVVNVRETRHAIWRDEFTYIERTAICQNNHRVMRLTKTRLETSGGG